MIYITFDTVKSSLSYNKCNVCHDFKNLTLNECNDCLCLICNSCDKLHNNICKRCNSYTNSIIKIPKWNSV